MEILYGSKTITNVIYTKNYRDTSRFGLQYFAKTPTTQNKTGLHQIHNSLQQPIYLFSGEIPSKIKWSLTSSLSFLGMKMTKTVRPFIRNYPNNSLSTWP